jgi:beta-N-acetylhexosaminidase
MEEGRHQDLRLGDRVIRRRARIVAVLALALAGCTSSATSGHGSSQPTPSTSRTSPAASTSAAPTTSSSPSPPVLSRAQQVLARMTEAERVGQLFMVDCPTSGVAAATVDAIVQHHVGSVILDGTSQLSLQATAGITAQLQRQAPPGVGLFIATDQEGGLVQRLQGPGFSAIPSAVEQGGYAPALLAADAERWGAELKRAGVNVNLAPVLDTVPAGFGSNPPIGDLDREYGHDPAHVTVPGISVANGLARAGVDATVKHFPGLGRVSGNTDVSTGVLDAVTTRHDAYLAPFAAAVRSHVPFVMLSTAIYTRIDATHLAAFSRTIVTGMLRGDLRFRGVIISDDIGIAKQVSGYSIGGRAVAFIAAGGDMVLTVDATQAAAMTSAVLARAKTDRAFRAQVDAAALVVLRAKQGRGLLR